MVPDGDQTGVALLGRELVADLPRVRNTGSIGIRAIPSTVCLCGWFVLQHGVDVPRGPLDSDLTNKQASSIEPVDPASTSTPL